MTENSAIVYFYFNIMEPDLAVSTDPVLEDALNDYILSVWGTLDLGDTPCFYGLNEERFDEAISSMDDYVNCSEKVVVINNSPLMARIFAELYRREVFAFFIQANEIDIKDYGTLYNNKRVFNGYSSQSILKHESEDTEKTTALIHYYDYEAKQQHLDDLELVFKDVMCFHLDLEYDSTCFYDLTEKTFESALCDLVQSEKTYDKYIVLNNSPSMPELYSKLKDKGVNVSFVEMKTIQDKLYASPFFADIRINGYLAK